MTSPGSFPLMAVDAGNSRIKLGIFDGATDENGLPLPTRTLRIDTDQWDPVEVALWLAPHAPNDFNWRVSSVHGPSSVRLRDWLDQEGVDGVPDDLTCENLPLVICLTKPQQVGTDRLAAAVAANRLRPQDRSAVIVDVGSAITVDVLSREGSFCGGAILPGIGMSARALHEFTDRLPNVGVDTLDDPPPALGTSTDEAIASGIYWGAVGAVRMLIEQLNQEMDEEPFVVLTGGTADTICERIGSDVVFRPHLVLSGIALAASDR